MNQYFSNHKVGKYVKALLLSFINELSIFKKYLIFNVSIVDIDKLYPFTKSCLGLP